MRRVCFRSYGGPEVLKTEDAPRPEPGEGELLVEVGAVGVTYPVVRLTRRPDVALPHVPGGDVVGRVVAAGPGLAERVGERVAALAFDGAYAELAVVPAMFAFPVPDAVDDAGAVGLVRGGQVALGALRAGAVHAGESVVVTGAAGGVGHLAVQLARELGAARVVAAVGDRAKAGFVRDLGADEVVTYDEEWGAPADVVVDGVGGDVQAAALRALAPLGRLVAYSGAGRPVDVNELRAHGRSVVGFAMRPFVAGRPEAYARQREELWDLYARERLIVGVHRTLPLEEAAEAHRIIERRENRGRVLLRP
ncbi:quinone oxidoreductase family protein [Actinoallomurus sp. CA-142502]|uniref:quinone oxidoreductase family protein n=1 Tax=Actinoallomurus sp. CA-142502 TaxID=3239885 RepID=UPI003D9409D3